ADKSIKRLGSMLGPILCCTTEQQSRFQTRFDAHFASAIDAERPRPPTPPRPPPVPSPTPVNTHVLRLGIIELWRSLTSRQRREITMRLFITCTVTAFILYALPNVLLLFG